MARKTVDIQIDDRGNKLDFVIEEMPATQLERWITRAVICVSGSANTDISSVGGLSQAGDMLAGRGLGVLTAMLNTLDYDKVAPLLDEMLACCYRKVDGGVRMRCTPALLDGFVEDVSTIFKLRMEAIKLNLGFLAAEDGPLSGFRRKPDTATQ